MFKQILLPVDFGAQDSADKAIAAAVGLCRQFGADLHVVTVLPGYSMSIISQYFPADYEKKAGQAMLKQIQDFIAKTVPGGLTAHAHVATGTIYKEILFCGQSVGCDLIVVGSNRAGHEEYLLGPNAARVVRHAKCSVFVVRD